jgi:predicted permease
MVVALISASSVAGLSPTVENQLAPGLPVGLYIAGILSAILVLELAFLWWTGLQVLPTYLGSGILPVFETLPVDEGTLDRLALILLWRLFDVPAAVCLIVTPLAVGVALDSIPAALAVIPAVGAMVLLAIAFALATGKFFVRRVQGARGGSGQTILRWAYLVLWAIPAFAMYGFLTFGSQFFGFLSYLISTGPPIALAGVAMAFPVSFSLLPVYADGGAISAGLPGAVSFPLVALASGAYFILTIAAALWVRGAARSLVRQVPDAEENRTRGHTHLATRRPFVAVLWKDLRTASRTPGYAFLILLPILDAVAVGLLAFVANPSASGVFNLGAAAVATAALLATFFGPAFFAIEAMGFAYTRTLPLTNRSLLVGKITLIAVLYLVAAALILALTSARVFAPGLFVLFVLAEFPAVLAAGFFELGVLFRMARKAGIPIVNLYSGAWRVSLVTVPGLILDGLPLALFEFLLGGPSASGLLIMGLVSVAELALSAPVALGLNPRRAE